MSRQARRKEERTKSKKIGQLLATRNELSQPKMRVKNYVANRKRLIRLEGELMDLGVIKRPTKWQIFWGRLKATFRFQKRLRVVR